ncbi:MAG: hypothetical protein NXI27_29380 [Alphaproteobacteria bacterium]|nr:hypothetical protein [Alphaproteobacteria bacterium]
MANWEDCLIWIEDLDPPQVRVTWSVYSWQNPIHVRRRAEKLARKYVRGWHCEGCNEVMPVWKRVDATYCSETCRKRAARQRRAQRKAVAGC